ncbi:C40 family peptidase [Demequina phytophila]|uniref:C40 family peptidase n=1 Tax=Demequina phytophila TaxID=1638981 RepID=UPI0007831C8D|nr:NlpC/P60 family protein [Demequina phytophila]
MGSSADPAELPDGTDPAAPDPDPVVVSGGRVAATTAGASANALHLTGEATFTATGDPDSLGGDPFMAAVTYTLDTGRTVTERRAATVTRVTAAGHAWAVPFDRTVGSSGRVTVALGGVTAAARFGKVDSSTSRWAVTGTTKEIKAGTTWSRRATVTPAYGRVVHLQAYRDGRWTTVKRARTANARTATVAFTFDGDDSRWYATGRSTYRYRVVAPATRALRAATSPALTVRPTMAYRARTRHIQPVLSIAQKPGGYSLEPGRNGNKVKAVQRALGMGSRWETMDAATVDRVRRFQRSRGIPSTGVVNERTWRALGLSAASWTELGGYTHPVVADRSSTRAERIEIMISTAMTYVGSEYVWGGSGTPREGADCSGLVMQAMYAAGMPTGGTDVVRHTDPGFRTTRALYGANYEHVPLSRAKRGDLIFFTSNGGTASGIIHMGIYLGGGRMVDMSTTSNTTQARSIHALDRYTDIVPEVVRVFS